MDFKQIEAFVNVARYKSFSKAADAMFFTQPTISAHVAALENIAHEMLLAAKQAVRSQLLMLPDRAQTFLNG